MGKLDIATNESRFFNANTQNILHTKYIKKPIDNIHGIFSNITELSIGHTKV